MIKLFLLTFAFIFTISSLAIAMPNFDLPTRPLPPIHPIPPTCSGTEYIDLEVGPTQTFRTINEALQHAKNFNICRLTLKLNTNDYFENIEITRPTRIMTIGRVALRGSVLNANGNNLSVTGVRFFEAKPFAIKQVGGRIEIKNCQIISTTKDPNNLESGIGIVLENVKGIIENTEINLSQIQAVNISGRGSQVQIKNLRIDNTNWDSVRVREIQINNPSTLRYIGAFEVLNGAIVRVENSTFDRNKFMVFNISQSARVDLIQTQITNTQQFDQGTGAIGGQPALVHNNGILRGDRIIIDGAVMGLTSHASFVSLVDSRVQNVVWGIAVQAQSPDFNTAHCTLNQGSQVMASERPFIYLDSPVASICHSSPETCAIPCP